MIDLCDAAPRWMIWYERHDKNALQAARRYGIAPKTFWNWRKRFREDGLATLEELSRVPLNKRTRTITQQEELRIVDLRRTYLRYGKEKRDCKIKCVWHPGASPLKSRHTHENN